MDWLVGYDPGEENSFRPWLLEVNAFPDLKQTGDELRELCSTLRRIRDEELEHLDHAVENDAKKAEPHWLLTNIIRTGCRGAIWVSERV